MSVTMSASSLTMAGALRLSLLVAGLVAQVAGLVLLWRLGAAAAGQSALAAAALHVGGALLGAEALARLRPRHDDGQPGAARLLGFVTGVFASAPGLLGLAVVLRRLDRARPAARRHEPRIIAPPVAQAGPARPAPPLRPGSLAGKLRGAEDPRVRMRAVMALRHIPDRQAIPLLRLALRDPADDVRLLSYAVLEARQGAIHRRLKELRDALETATPADRPALHLQSAERYWELAYQGLVEGELRAFMLAEARRHLTEVLKAEPHQAAHHLLLGRIQIAARAFHEAGDSLERARDLGLPPRVLNPYFAEIAFAERRFSDVRLLLRSLGTAPRRPVLSRLVEYWQ
jgi:tetratricopeptide (TPR) repeat protein